MAAAVILVGLAVPVLAMIFLGDAEDARVGGSVIVEPLPPQPMASELANINLETPDLLAGEVAANTNPTEAIQAELDALGNPITSSPTVTTPADIPVTSGASGSTGSKMIKIDGVAIGPTSLPPAPIPGLTQTSSFGPVPARSADGGSALTHYNRPFTQPAGKRPVSIIIGGLGINRTLTQQAIDNLPPDVTLSFAAHATGLQDWIDRARAAGHEVIIELPMESDGFDPSEPGAERALRLNVPAQNNRRNLDWLMSRAQGYWGVTNYNGEAFLRRADAAAPLLDRLSQTGVGLITDGSFQTPTLGALSRSVKLPYKSGFGLIDPDPNTAVIQARLSDLATMAKGGSHPVGVGFAYPETLNSVIAWVAELDQQGLVLAPASSAVK
ncbi:divergent polysaccharide deacetylase family protein [Litorimonas sp. RW-G-Af-16]|uniref:divergent polysaccharide deacetylase family protein n=1 Tax=Litorimonas sp. RW-G-Af-16 TaxID=3241168 RepID=UPI00390CAE84